MSPRARATCHPDRAAYVRRLCRACYYQAHERAGSPHGRKRGRYNLSGLNHLGDLEHELPFRQPPRACLKCGNAVLARHPARPEVSCPLCGWETFCRPEAGVAAMREYVIPYRREVAELAMTGGR